MTDRIIQGKAGFHSFKLLHLCLVLLNLFFFFKLLMGRGRKSANLVTVRQVEIAMQCWAKCYIFVI